MIILEGPDGGGKTRLAKQIYEDWEGRFQLQAKAVSSAAESLRPIGQYVEEEIAKGFGPRLYDRFALISSPLYMHLPNRTFRDEMLDPFWLVEQYRHFWKIDPVIIVCLPPIDIVRINVQDDPDSPNPEVERSIDTIYWNYHNWLAQEQARTNTSVIRHDYTNPDALALSGILNWANGRIKVGR